MIGPFPGDVNYNDAKITEEIIDKETEIMDLMNSNNTCCILDRGFRDAQSPLEAKGINVQMPAFKPKGVNQLSPIDANRSRLVTKLRFVVETVHGRFKTIWPFFKNTISNTLIPVIGPSLRIAIATLNAFRSHPVVFRPEVEEEAREMLMKSEQETNPLADRILTNSSLSFRNKQNWEPMDSFGGAEEFPTLEIEDIRQITYGPYQLRKAQHYTAEHLNANGDFLFQACRSEPGLLRCHIQSRHSNASKYNLCVQYNRVCVIGYCCSCTPGKRTLGCCSHITTIIWYIGYARHNPGVIVNSHTSGACLRRINKPCNK